MRAADAAQFGQVLAATLDVYGRSCSPMTVRIWFEALAPYSLSDVQRALSQHLTDPNTGQYPPKPADVIKHLVGDRATLEAQAALAWAKLSRALSSVGGYASVAFDDAAIHAAVEAMGGWIKLTSTPENELPFRAKDFDRYYMALRAQPTFEYPAILPGRAETERNAGGLLKQFPVAPVLIGPEPSVRAVIEHGRSRATTVPEGGLAGLLSHSLSQIEGV